MTEFKFNKMLPMIILAFQYIHVYKDRRQFGIPVHTCLNSKRYIQWMEFADEKLFEMAMFSIPKSIKLVSTVSFLV